jgi:hypothetical protein
MGEVIPKILLFAHLKVNIFGSYTNLYKCLKWEILACKSPNHGKILYRIGIYINISDSGTVVVVLVRKAAPVAENGSNVRYTASCNRA